MHVYTYIYVPMLYACIYTHIHTLYARMHYLIHIYINIHTHYLEAQGFGSGPALSLIHSHWDVYVCIYVYMCVYVYLSLPYKEGRGLFFSVSRVATVENKNRTLVFFIDNLVSWIH